MYDLWSSMPRNQRPERVAKMRRWRTKTTPDRREIERLVRYEPTDALWLEHLALAVEAALSLALRELLTVVLVDRFCITFDAAHRLQISMKVRSPLCYTELATEADPRDTERGAEALVENQVALAMADLLGEAWMADLRAEVTRQDHLVCSFTIHAPAPYGGAPGEWNGHAEQRGVDDSVASGARQ